MTEALPGIDAILFDVGGTLVAEAAPGTPVDQLQAAALPGVVDAMPALAAHHRLGAVTDTAVMDEHAVRKLLAPIGLDAVLDSVVTSSDAGAAKPDPRLIEQSLDRLDVTRDRTLFIGNALVDRDAALAAAVLFTGAHGPFPSTLERARMVASLPRVPALDGAARDAAAARHEELTKPSGALGQLEALGIHLAAISGACPPPVPARPGVAVFAADHGVVAAGVTPWPQEITAAMVANFAAGGAAINVIARAVGASVHVVDVGVAGAVPSGTAVIDRKVRAGTANMADGPAMTLPEARAAVEVGVETARTLIAAGHDLLVTGDMGIGNTTPSAACIAALTGNAAGAVTGRGTGIDDEMLAIKLGVVERALDRIAPIVDPLTILAEVGGLEIAALAGFCIAGAAARVPVLVDGVIACAALCVADALAPGTAARCIAGHRSVEPGASAALAHLGLQPLLDLDLRLGEGTGACLAVPLVRAAAAILGEMATFDDLARLQGP